MGGERKMKAAVKAAVKTVKAVKKASTTKKASASKQVDPLYVIFEQHLFSFSDAESDRKTFITNVVNDYLTYLRKNNIIVPKSLEQPIVEELGTQVNTMLVKKIYGCLSISDYVGNVGAVTKKKAKSRYQKMTSEKKTG